MNTDRIRTWRMPRLDDPTPAPIAPRVQPPATRTLREIERDQFDRFERGAERAGSLGE